MSKTSSSNLYLDAKTSFLEPKVEQFGSHMVMTNVTRASKTKYVNIDSKFPDTVTSTTLFSTEPQEYVFTLPERINNVKSIQVSTAEIPVSYYNFSAALGNNLFYIKNLSNSAISTVTLPDGYYSSYSSLASAVQTAVTSQVANITFTIGSTQPVSTFSSSNVTSYQVIFDTTDASSNNLYQTNMQMSLGWALGFRVQSITLTTNVSVVSSAIVSLRTIKYLYFVVDEFTSSFTNSFISPFRDYILNKKILAKASMDNTFYPFGSVANLTRTNGFLLSDVRHYNGKVDLLKLKIQLVNEFGTPVSLNGLDFNLVLEVVYE